GRVDVEVDFLSSVLVLQVEQLLDCRIGQGVVDAVRSVAVIEHPASGNEAEEDDAVVEQHVAEAHLPLPHHVSVALDMSGPGKMRLKNIHGLMAPSRLL